MAFSINPYKIDVDQLFSEPKLWMKPPTPEEVFASFQDRGVYDGSVQDIVRPLFSDVVCPDGDDTLTVFGYLLTGMYPAFKTHNGESKVSFPYASEIGVCNEVTKRASQMATRLLQGPLLDGATRINFYKTSRNLYRPVVFGECVIGGKRSKWLDFPDFYFAAAINGDIPKMGTSISNPEWQSQLGGPRVGYLCVEIIRNSRASVYTLGGMYE
jgi:hypothetical protein